MTDGHNQTEIDALFAEYARSRRQRDRNELVKAHMGFAHHVARRFANRGVPEADLKQIALLALVKAVDRFDPERGAAFTSFAGRTVEGEIKRHFRDATWAVRVPRSTKELHLAVRRANEDLSQTLGRSPSVPEVARHLRVDVDQVVEALAASAAFSAGSLDSSPGTEEAGDRSALLASTDVDLEDSEDRILVEDLIAALPPREQEIVRMRYYEELTQSEIAERMGMSQMHVSRLLRQSFEQMREVAGPAGRG